MIVSSGTYVRSIVHDLGIVLGSAAHVVKLTRTRQGAFVLNPSDPSTAIAIGEKTEADTAAAGVSESTATTEAAPAAAEASTDAVPVVADASAAPPPPAADAPAAPAAPILETFAGGCIEWSTLAQAIADLEKAKKSGSDGPARNADGWLPWELELLRRCKEV